MPEQPVGVGKNAFGRRLVAKLCQSVVVELAAAVQMPARDKRVADAADEAAVDVHGNLTATGGTQPGDDRHHERLTGPRR